MFQFKGFITTSLIVETNVQEAILPDYFCSIVKKIVLHIITMFPEFSKYHKNIL